MIVYLRITDFRGSVPGATHFFGELQGGDHFVPLYHKLSRRQAAAINRISLVKYRPGENYPGFDSKDEVIAAARKAWQQEFPEAAALHLYRPKVLGGDVQLDEV